MMSSLPRERVGCTISSLIASKQSRLSRLLVPIRIPFARCADRSALRSDDPQAIASIESTPIRAYFLPAH